jgi:serine/threonine protein phosphatase PrpC
MTKNFDDHRYSISTPMRIQPRHPRQSRYYRYSLTVHALLVGCLLIVFPKEVLSLSSSPSLFHATANSSTQNVNDAHAKDRVLYASDIIFDESIRAALKLIRKPVSSPDTTDTTTVTTTDTKKGSLSIRKRVSLGIKGLLGIRKSETDISITTSSITAEQAREEALQHLAVTGNSDQLTLTLTGYKGGNLSDQINQDRGFVWQRSTSSSSSSSESSLKQDEGGDNGNLLMVGVLDGHGTTGHHVSEYATGELIRQLGAQLKREDTDSVETIQEGIRDAFLRVDESIPRKSANDGGATASIVLRKKDTLFVANAGDSQSLIAAVSTSSNTATTADKTSVVLLYASRLDKPDLAEERARILEAGGIVSEESEEDVARVSYELNGHAYGLAMSRGLGDANAIGVTAEPIVDVFSIADLMAMARKELQETCLTDDPSSSSSETAGTCGNTGEPGSEPVDNTNDGSNSIHLFVVSATDGLLDYFEPTELARVMGASFYDPASQLHPLKAAEGLIHAAAKEWWEEMDGKYRDDITISAAKIIL